MAVEKKSDTKQEDPRDVLATQFLISLISGNPHTVDTDPKAIGNCDLVKKAYALADAMLTK